MIEVKIYYEDTDAGGIVYYANYLRYFERARTEYFSANGFDIKKLADQGVLFVVAHAEVDYHSSARLGDILQIETTIKEPAKVSFWVDYSVKNKTDGKLIVTGRTKMACVSANLKIQKIPVEMLEKIQQG